MNDEPTTGVIGFAELDALLDQALQLEEDEQRSFLHGLKAAQRALVESLLRRTEATGIDDMKQAIQTSLKGGTEEGAQDKPAMAGHWQLGEPLGAGGMGQVFRATRTEHGFVQDGAVKVLWSHRADEDFRARFFRERRILASLDHPGLARFLDGGLLEDGRPWFAMELVEGVDVISYTRSLSIAARLDLFLDICAAVEYAHERLIVHRDIKPHNILIDASGRPRLLDFGVASVVDGIDDGVTTRAGGSPITLKYASPEQVTGKLVTVGSDVYQLGMLLYEILTGRLPYTLEDKSLQQTIEIICSDRVSPPSRFRKGLAPDLDAVVLTALRKDTTGRYRSVSAFADDVRRFAGGRPVRARPRSRWYVARKFVQRNLLPVSIIALSAVALSVATVVSIKMAREARAEARRSQTTQQILADVFQQADPFGENGGNVTLADALQAAQPSIREQIADDPRLAWEVNRTLADIFTSLGLLELEIESYEDALAAARALPGSNDREVILAIAGLGNTLVRTNPTEAIEFFAGNLPPAPSGADTVLDWLSAKYAEVNALNRLRRYSEADEGALQMAAVVEQFDIEAPRTRGRLSQLLAGRARRAGDMDAADMHWRDAAEYMRKAGKPAAHAVILSNMGIHFGRDGRYPEAEAAFQESLAVFAEHSPDDPSHGSVMRTYAGLLFRTERQAEAMDQLNAALEILAGPQQGYSRYVALVNVAEYGLVTGRIDEALGAAEKGVALALSEFGADSDVTNRILTPYARTLQFAGHYRTAGAIVTFAAQNYPGTETQLARAHTALDAARHDEAEQSLQEMSGDKSAATLAARLRLSCARGDRLALADILAEAEPAAEGASAAAKDLRAWSALVTAALAVDKPGAVASAHAAFEASHHAFRDVLTQWRMLSALGQLAVISDSKLPATTGTRLIALAQSRQDAHLLVAGDHSDGTTMTLASLGLVPHPIETTAPPAPPAFCAGLFQPD